MEKINKTESHSSLSTPFLSERGQPAIITSRAMIDDCTHRMELDINRRCRTFDIMMLDSSVYTPYTATQDRVLMALSSIRFVKNNKGTRRSERAAEYLNYCINNMTYGTWFEFCNNLITATKYGWSDVNIVCEKRNYGPYSGRYVLRKLSPRDQKSIYGWLWNTDMTEWIGAVQRPNVKQDPTALSRINNKYNRGLDWLSIPKLSDGRMWPVLRREQLVHASYNGTLNNPQGFSPLMAIFDDWYEKELIGSLVISGIARDLKGTLILRTPSKLMYEANNAEEYPQSAEEYQSLQENAAAVINGEETFIVLASDRDNSGEYVSTVELLAGTTGAGAYDTSEIIMAKTKSIYLAFNAAHLLLGQDGSGGSNGLSSNQMTQHGYRIAKDIAMYIDVIKNQLVPRLLAINGEYLNYNEMPEIEYDDFEPTSYNELSSFAQRMKSTGSLTPKMLKVATRSARLPIEGIDELDFTTDNVRSRAGDGMATAGQGTSTTVGGVDASVANNANVAKSFVLDKDRIIDSVTGECINEDQLDKNGYYK